MTFPEMGSVFGRVHIQYDSSGIGQVTNELEAFRSQAERATSGIGGSFNHLQNALHGHGNQLRRGFASIARDFASLGQSGVTSAGTITGAFASIGRGIKNSLGLAANNLTASGGQLTGAAAAVGGSAGTALGRAFSAAASLAIKGGIAAIVTAIGAVGGMGLKRLVSLDEAKYKLKALGHSAQEIEGVMKNVNNAVLGTAYSLDEAATAAAQALAAGIKPGKDLEAYLKGVANLAAITGREFNDMAMILGRVQAAGKLTGLELRQLEYAGLAIVPILAKSMGKSQAEIRGMVTDGKITAKDFRKAVTEEMGDAAQVMGNSIKGSLKNLKAAIGRLGESLLGPLFAADKDKIAPIPALINRVSKAIDEMGKTVKKWMTENKDQIENFGKTVGTVFTTIGKVLGPALKVAFVAIGESIRIVIAVMRAFAQAVQPIVDRFAPALKSAFDNAGGSADGFIEKIRRMAPGIAHFLATGIAHMLKFGSIVAKTLSIASKLFNGFTKVLTGVAKIFGKAMMIMLSGLEAFGKGAAKVLGPLGKWLDKFISTITGKASDVFGNINTELEGLSRGLEEFSKATDQASKDLDQASKSLEEYDFDAAMARRDTKKLGEAASDAADDEEDLGDAAGETTDKLKDQKVALEDIKKSLHGSDEEFEKFLKSMRDKGASQEFLNYLTQMRQAVLQAGPGVANLADALKKLSDHTVTANDKAKDLIKSWKQLGLIPGEAEDAAMAYWETIDEVTNVQDKWIDPLNKTGKALILQNGQLDKADKNGRALVTKFSKLREETFSMAAAGHDAGETWEKSAEAMRIIGRQIGITGPEMEELIVKYLGPKHTFTLQFQAVGGDELRNDLISLLTMVDAAKAKGEDKIEFNIGMTGNVDEMNKVLEKAGARVKSFDKMSGMATIEIYDKAKFEKERANLEATLRKPIETKDGQPVSLSSQVTVDKKDITVPEDPVDIRGRVELKETDITTPEGVTVRIQPTEEDLGIHTQGEDVELRGTGKPRGKNKDGQPTGTQGPSAKELLDRKKLELENLAAQDPERFQKEKDARIAEIRSLEAEAEREKAKADKEKEERKSERQRQRYEQEKAQAEKDKKPFPSMEEWRKQDDEKQRRAREKKAEEQRKKQEEERRKQEEEERKKREWEASKTGAPPPPKPAEPQQQSAPPPPPQPEPPKPPEQPKSDAAKRLDDKKREFENFVAQSTPEQFEKEKDKWLGEIRTLEAEVARENAGEPPKPVEQQPVSETPEERARREAEAQKQKEKAEREKAERERAEKERDKDKDKDKNKNQPPEPPKPAEPPQKPSEARQPEPPKPPPPAQPPAPPPPKEPFPVFVVNWPEVLNKITEYLKPQPVGERGGASDADTRPITDAPETFKNDAAGAPPAEPGKPDDAKTIKEKLAKGINGAINETKNIFKEALKAPESKSSENEPPDTSKPLEPSDLEKIGEGIAEETKKIADNMRTSLNVGGAKDVDTRPQQTGQETPPQETPEGGPQPPPDKEMAENFKETLKNSKEILDDVKVIAKTTKDEGKETFGALKDSVVELGKGFVEETKKVVDKTKEATAPEGRTPHEGEVGGFSLGGAAKAVGGGIKKAGQAAGGAIRAGGETAAKTVETVVPGPAGQAVGGAIRTGAEVGATATEGVGNVAGGVVESTATPMNETPVGQNIDKRTDEALYRNPPPRDEGILNKPQGGQPAPQQQPPPQPAPQPAPPQQPQQPGKPELTQEVSDKTIDSIQKIMKAAGWDVSKEKIKERAPGLLAAMKGAGINTPKRAQAFLTQVAKETAGLKFFEEQGEQARKKFGGYHGRGALQVTHKENYANLGKWAKEKGYISDPDYFVKHPEELSGSKWGFLSAEWYWATQGPVKGKGKHFNVMADEGDIEGITQGIYGRNQPERTDIYKRIGSQAQGELENLYKAPPPPPPPPPAPAPAPAAQPVGAQQPSPPSGPDPRGPGANWRPIDKLEIKEGGWVVPKPIPGTPNKYSGIPLDQAPTSGDAADPGWGKIQGTQWIAQMAKIFGLYPGTRRGHQAKDGKEYGIDWYPSKEAAAVGHNYQPTAEEAARMEAFAKYIQRPEVAKYVEQMIFQARSGEKMGVVPTKGGKPLPGKPESIGQSEGGVLDTSGDYYGMDPGSGYPAHRSHVHTRSTYEIPMPGKPLPQDQWTPPPGTQPQAQAQQQQPQKPSGTSGPGAKIVGKKSMKDLPEILKAVGLEVETHPGWENRGQGQMEGPIWGVMAHHTGNPNERAEDLAKHPTMGGMAAHLMLGKEGKVTVLGTGKAWHAGKGSYPGLEKDNANKNVIGIEAVHAGTRAPGGAETRGAKHREGWSDQQYNAYVKMVAAILTAQGLTPERAIGHYEYSLAAQGKWDPGGIDMNIFRKDVGELQKKILASNQTAQQQQPQPSSAPATSGQPSQPSQPSQDTSGYDQASQSQDQLTDSSNNAAEATNETAASTANLGEQTEKTSEQLGKLEETNKETNESLKGLTAAVTETTESLNKLIGVIAQQQQPQAQQTETQAAVQGAQGASNIAASAGETGGPEEQQTLVQNAQSLRGATLIYNPDEVKKLGIKPLYEEDTDVKYGEWDTGKLPKWIEDLAKKHKLEVATYGDSTPGVEKGGLHQAGYAFDFQGAADDLEKFAKEILKLYKKETIQLIYQSQSGKQYGIAGGQQVGSEYYAGDTFSKHKKHLHWAPVGDVTEGTRGGPTDTLTRPREDLNQNAQNTTSYINNLGTEARTAGQQTKDAFAQNTEVVQENQTAVQENKEATEESTEKVEELNENTEEAAKNVDKLQNSAEEANDALLTFAEQLVAFSGGNTRGTPSSVTLSAGSIEGLNEEQTKNAKAIIEEGMRRGLSEDVIKAALSAALVESNLQPGPTATDHDSLGAFQQRPSQGWGSPEQVQDIRYASGQFYDRAGTMQGQAPGDIAANVQRPREDLRYKYTQKMPEAERIYGQLMTGATVTPLPAPAPTTPPSSQPPQEISPPQPVGGPNAAQTRPQPITTPPTQPPPTTPPQPPPQQVPPQPTKPPETQQLPAEAAKPIDDGIDKARIQGERFAESFALGMKNKLPVVRQAATQIAETAAGALPGSPAKYGPLSGRGSTESRGERYSSAFATGIISNLGMVKGAAVSIAYGAGTPLKDRFAKFVDDISELSNFGRKAFQLFMSAIDIGVNIMKMFSNLKGNNDAAEKARQAALAGQVPETGTQTSIAPQVQATGGKPSDTTTSDTGKPAETGGPTKDQTQPQPGKPAEVTVNVEDKRKPEDKKPEDKKPEETKVTVEDKRKPEDKKKEEQKPPQPSIQRTPEEVKPGGKPEVPKEVTQPSPPPERPTGTTQPAGGKPPEQQVVVVQEPAVDQSHVIQPQKPTGTTPPEPQKPTSTTQPTTTTGQQRTTPESFQSGPPLPGKGVTYGPGWVQSQGLKRLYAPGTNTGGYGGNTAGLPPEVVALAAQFGLSPSTYPSGGSLHEAGFAFDLTMPGKDRMSKENQAAMTAFANYVMTNPNLLSNTMQLIYQNAGTGKTYGVAGGQVLSGMEYYGAGTYGEHQDHVHWATTVAPILGAGNANALGGLGLGTGADTSHMMGQQGAKGAGETIMDQVGTIAGGMSTIINDAFEIFESSLKAIKDTKMAGDILARGISNTEDIMKMVDTFQTFLELGQKIAQTVSDVAGFVAQMMPSQGDPFGGMAAAQQAVQMVSAIAGVVAGVIGLINTSIELAQEAYKIGTKYMGRMLQAWLGLPGANDVRYLLDTLTGELKAYTTENPELKHTFNTLGKELGYRYGDRIGAQNQFNIYQGPGQDPRDTMSDAMFAVRSSGVGTFGYTGQ